MYGDKSNEELLFLYGMLWHCLTPGQCLQFISWCLLWVQATFIQRRVGDACGCAGFAVEDNASDMLMVKCPLPPVEQWDELIRARLRFLLDQGLSPQLFLLASNVPADADSKVRGPIYLTAWLQSGILWYTEMQLGVVLVSASRHIWWHGRLIGTVHLGD